MYIEPPNAISQLCQYGTTITTGQSQMQTQSGNAPADWAVAGLPNTCTMQPLRKIYAAAA